MRGSWQEYNRIRTVAYSGQPETCSGYGPVKCLIRSSCDRAELLGRDCRNL